MGTTDEGSVYDAPLLPLHERFNKIFKNIICSKTTLAPSSGTAKHVYL